MNIGYITNDANSYTIPGCSNDASCGTGYTKIGFSA
jgi:hypothetical protein